MWRSPTKVISDRGGGGAEAGAAAGDAWEDRAQPVLQPAMNFIISIYLFWCNSVVMICYYFYAVLLSIPLYFALLLIAVKRLQRKAVPVKPKCKNLSL